MSDFTNTYLAFDGSTVEIASDTALGEVYTADGIVSIGQSEFEFTAGPLTMGQDIANNPEVSVGMLFTEVYSFQNGTLKIGEGQQPVGPDLATYTEPLRLAVWEGVRHSVHTTTYGGDSAQLLYAFNQVTINEVDTGVILTPATGEGTLNYVTGPGLGVDVPPVALMDIVQLTDRVEEFLPSFDGTDVEGGELFKAGSSDSEPMYLLITPSAVVYVLPHSWSSRAAVLEFITGLTVEWHAYQ